MEKVTFTTVDPVNGTLCEEFSAVAHHTFGVRNQQSSTCQYVRECKDAEGKTTLKEIFFFTQGKVKIFRYGDGKETASEVKNLREYEDKESLNKTYLVFGAHHHAWGLPGRIPALNLD